MKILYFHQHFSTPAGSTGTRSYEMARALIRAGHEVTMVCGTYHGGISGLDGAFNKGKRSGNVDGIKVVELELVYSNYQSLARRSWVFLKFALRSISIALREPCELVFATTTPLTAGLPGIFARWLRGRCFVFEVRDLWPELPKAMGVIKNPVILWLMSVLEWASYRSAHACIGLSPGIVEGIKKRSRAEQPVAMIPNGCDFELFSAANIQPQRPDGVGETDTMAVFTGAHGIANGLDAVVRAAEVLKQRGRDDIKLVFIGNGRLKPELRRVTEENKLDNCIFLDPVPKGELAAYMKGADIGLMILANIPAFYYGTSPNKFFDYLSIGLPVLNNYPGWLADMIKEHECGYAVEPGNAEKFANALEDAAAHRQKLQLMGERARALGKKEFDREKLAAQFVVWLEKAV
ncbi:MAG: glycosyltransferase family 4 protein [Thermodesulfobacteriota bacterium]|nr:glycosyltransferase family 4 protein [Thermodesulfobacteriota bacterium]